MAQVPRVGKVLPKEASIRKQYFPKTDSAAKLSSTITSGPFVPTTHGWRTTIGLNTPFLGTWSTQQWRPIIDLDFRTWRFNISTTGETKLSLGALITTTRPGPTFTARRDYSSERAEPIISQSGSHILTFRQNELREEPLTTHLIGGLSTHSIPPLYDNNRHRDIRQPPQLLFYLCATTLSHYRHAISHRAHFNRIFAATDREQRAAA